MNDGMANAEDVQLVIFDFNGTLQDDLALYYEYSVRRVFARYGLPAPSVEEYRREVSAADYTAFFHARGIPRSVHGDDLYAQVYEDMMADGATAPLFADAKPTIDALRALPCRTAVVTSMQTSMFDSTLARHGIAGDFDAIRSSVRDKRDAFTEVLRELDVTPSHAWAVDDMVDGLRAAHAVGIRPFGCPRGHQSRERIEALQGELSGFVLIETLVLVSETLSA